jgi:hypothetical protein
MAARAVLALLLLACLALPGAQASAAERSKTQALLLGAKVRRARAQER